jgi:two-component sensor histidine kinase
MNGPNQGKSFNYFRKFYKSKPLWAILLALWNDPAAIAQPLSDDDSGKAIEIQGVVVDDKSLSLSNITTLTLKPYSRDISIHYGPNRTPGWIPLRFQYRMDGYNNSWQEDVGQMCLIARFFDESNNQISEVEFDVTGSSPGWRGELKTSSFNHRHESVTVPLFATRLVIVMASTGAPSTIGVYAIADLTASKILPNKSPQLLLQSPYQDDQSDWIRDGTHPTMAQIEELGQGTPPKKALLIIDNDLRAHAEWHNILASAPRVKSGDQIVIDWNEMYDMADGLGRFAHFQNLPPGQFRFRVAELDVTGNPTGIEVSLPIMVLQPIWKRPFFWVANIFGLSIMVGIGMYYIVRRKIRDEILHYERQRELEHERLRIARDIHDDLGARVTQISLASAMAQINPTYPEQARADFEYVSQMARDLVTALYETVWVVTPSNDNLKELGNYLFQISNKLFARTQCHCRFYVDGLSQETTISSHVRHNICMAVKEALNNIIKHANASEAGIRIAYKCNLLTVLIQDNGCGFQAEQKFTGSGLVNLKRRLSDIGGKCSIKSELGQGTTIELRLTIPPPT